MPLLYSFAAGTSHLHPLNPEGDEAFLETLASGDLEKVDGFSDDWITQEGGKSAHEIRTWIAAFATLAVSGLYQA